MIQKTIVGKPFYYKYTDPKTGVINILVHVDYSDGSYEGVPKDSEFDPLSPNYNSTIDQE